MNIRKWAGAEINDSEEYSNIDLLVNSILEEYYKITLIFIKESSTKNISELKEIIVKKESEIYFGFVKWINSEGFELLENISKEFYKEDMSLEEELNYLEFTIKSEAENAENEEYFSDVMGTIADISNKIKALLNLNLQ